MAFTKENLITNYEKQFDYSLMRAFIAYSLCSNSETQAVTTDANANDFQTTGGKDCQIAGNPVGALTADAEYVVASEPAYAVWAATADYVAVPADQDSLTEVFKYDVDLNEIHYACILAHTASAAGVDGDEPGVGANWRTYWRKMDQWATQAVGYTLEQAEVGHFLICADSGGFLKAFVAMDSDKNFQIPAFDPTRYVALATIAQTVVGATDWVFGTDDHDSESGTVVRNQILGSCYPDASLIK